MSYVCVLSMYFIHCIVHEFWGFFGMRYCLVYVFYIFCVCCWYMPWYVVYTVVCVVAMCCVFQVCVLYLLLCYVVRLFIASCVFCMFLLSCVVDQS